MRFRNPMLSCGTTERVARRILFVRLEKKNSKEKITFTSSHIISGIECFTISVRRRQRIVCYVDEIFNKTYQPVD